MSNQFYSEIVTQVNALLKQFGTQFEVRGPGQYVAEQLKSTPTTSRSVLGLVSNQELAANLSNDDGWIGKKILIISADAAIKSNEDVKVDGRWFALSKIVQIKPADVVVVYMLDVTL